MESCWKLIEILAWLRRTNSHLAFEAPKKGNAWWAKHLPKQILGLYFAVLSSVSATWWYQPLWKVRKKSQSVLGHLLPNNLPMENGWTSSIFRENMAFAILFRDVPNRAHPSRVQTAVFTGSMMCLFSAVYPVRPVARLFRVQEGPWIIELLYHQAKCVCGRLQFDGVRERIYSWRSFLYL